MTITTTAGVYENPLHDTDGVARTDPDPFGMKHRGRYYCYSTDEAGVQVSVSDDLVTWERHGFALQTPGQKNYWAPCVVHHEGTFYMYVSSAPADSDDPHDERLQLAVSDDPLGPFTVTTRFFDTFSIDADVVRDTDGEWYLFYSTNDATGLEFGNPGTAILVDRLVDFDRLAGEPRPVVVPTLREEIFAENRFGDGRDWYTIEGAAFFRRRGRAYLTYSGNAYVREDYFVGYASAEATGSLGDYRWAKYPGDEDYRPLIRRSGDVEGTGHNSIVTGPDLVETWIMYHGRDADQPLTPEHEQRTRRIDPLWFDGARLRTNAPSHGPQHAPAAPELRDLFVDASLDARWRVLDGAFTTGDYAAVAADDGRALAITERTFGSYRAELDLRARPSHLGARFGVRAAHFGDDAYVEVLLDAATRTVSAVRVAAGISSTLATAPLSRGALEAYRHLQIDRDFDRIVVRIDGVVALDFIAPGGEAAVGLTSTRTDASFSGFSITGHLELVGAELAGLARIVRAVGPAAVDADGIAARHGRAVELIADGLPDGWRVSLDFELLSSVTGRVSYRPADAGAHDHVRVEASGTEIHVVRVRDGRAETLATAALDAPDFTVHSRMRGTDLEIRIAGTVVLVADAPAPTSPRVELVAARLRGLEATSTEGRPQR